MKKPLIWIVAIIIIIIAYLYASPYLALRNIKNAAVKGDTDVLSEYIDFPRVKQSLKDQINAQIMKEVAKEDTDGFEALGAMLASAMIDPIVDKIVTPDGLALLVQGKNPGRDGSETYAEADVADTANKRPNIDYKASYVNYKTFKVTLSNSDDGTQPIDIIMHRDGLGWKVTRIVIANALEHGAATNAPSDTVTINEEEALIANTPDTNLLSDSANGLNIEDESQFNTALMEHGPNDYAFSDYPLDDSSINDFEFDDDIDPEVGFAERGDIISDEFAVDYDTDEEADLVF